MRSLTAAPIPGTEATPAPTTTNKANEKATNEKAMKPYPAFLQAIKEIDKDVEALVKEGEEICNKEKESIQDPTRKEIANDFIDFLRNVRQYWKIAVKTTDKLPIKTPSWLTLLADPKEFFKGEDEEDLDFMTGHTKEQKSKRGEALASLAKEFRTDYTGRGKSIPKSGREDQVAFNAYIKSLSDYITRRGEHLLESDDLSSRIQLIKELNTKLLGESVSESLSSRDIEEIIAPSKVKANFRSLSKFAAEDRWTVWKQKAEKISEKINDKLVPLYRNLSEAWMPEKFTKNRRMLRDFFVGKTAGAGLRFYGRDVLVPNIEVYLQRVYGKEEAPEQKQENDETLNKGKVEHQQAVWKQLAEEKAGEIAKAADEAIEGLKFKNEGVNNEQIDGAIIKLEEIKSDIGKGIEKTIDPKIPEEQRTGVVESLNNEVLPKLENVSKIVEEISKQEAAKVSEETKEPDTLTGSRFKALSVYAVEAETPSLLSPFDVLIQKVRQIADRIKQWMPKKEEEQQAKPTEEDEVKEAVKQKLAEVYREYKQKIIEGVEKQVEEIKKKGQENPEYSAKVNPFLDTFIEKLPEALDAQLEKYQGDLSLLLGSGNKAIQERFKKDAEEIIQGLFIKHVNEPTAKAATIRFRDRLRLGANELAPNDKVLNQKIQKDVKDAIKGKEEGKEGEVPKLDERVLDKILVDSFKATIDKNKEEVEALLSNSEK